ncbi:hypothetical protein MXD62_16555 [Frankia sp. Mgl5]|uniref:hypothetical protein n=1 Tax=Frankia sp. Mgl5 TaxID=2933793 RepID=UPI00200DC8A9|nr:hypothetical protein [Frankia sp. Mgl5]MCK9928767.1 hypothetical protein [Frankia sp. Mgl5]
MDGHSPPTQETATPDPPSDLKGWSDPGAGPGSPGPVEWLQATTPDADVLAVGAVRQAVILRCGRGPDLIVPAQAWERFLAEIRQGLYDNLFDH